MLRERVAEATGFFGAGALVVKLSQSLLSYLKVASSIPENCPTWSKGRQLRQLFQQKKRLGFRGASSLSALPVILKRQLGLDRLANTAQVVELSKRRLLYLKVAGSIPEDGPTWWKGRRLRQLFLQNSNSGYVPCSRVRQGLNVASRHLVRQIAS